MIRENIKNNKGISLITLTITVIVLLVLTSATIYNINDNLGINKLQNMQSDIDNLRNKIASYYAENGKIPASIKYINTDAINNMKNGEYAVISDAVDNGEFYIIDLAAIENLTLYYGKDFENVKKITENIEEQAKEYKDLYIINEASHNIFYVAGINIDGELFYTDYTKENMDKVNVDLRYVDNIKIPNGFYYLEGTIDTGIIIRSNSNKNVEYKWIQQNEKIEELPEGIELQDSQNENDFIESVNAYKGYYKNTTNETVYYLELEEKWSPEYDELGIYKDKNEDIAYIPKGFKVSEKPGENTIVEGLVVQAPDESEFVWIPVKTVVTDKEANGTSNKAMAINLGTDANPQYKGLLYNFKKTNSTVISGCTTTIDSNREPDNLSAEYDNNTNILNWTSTMYQEEYNKMIEKVKKYGGFYVGRYETSINGDTVASKKSTIPMSSATDNQTWYGMYEKQKQYASKNELTQIVGSSMIWGSQYDAIMNWMLTSDTEKNKVTSNSTQHDLTKTGETLTDKMNNIYDLGNNLCEWTLETLQTNNRVHRGGYSGNTSAATTRSAYHEEGNPETISVNRGSRITLYIE